MDGLDNRPVNAWAQGWVRLAGGRVAREGIFMRTGRQSMAAGRQGQKRGGSWGGRGGAPHPPHSPKATTKSNLLYRPRVNKLWSQALSGVPGACSF